MNAEEKTEKEPEKESKVKQSWLAVKDVIMTLIGFSLGVIAFYQFYNQPEGCQFAIESKFGAFELPVQLTDEMQVQSAIKLDEYKSLRGYIELSIMNVGDRPAEKVVINLDDKGIAVVDRVNREPEKASFEKRLEIGNLDIREPVNVRLWIDSGVFPKDDTVVVTHKLGEQPVRFSVPTYDDVTLWWLQKAQSIVLLLMLGFLIFSVVRVRASTKETKALYQASTKETKALYQASLDNTKEFYRKATESVHHEVNKTREMIQSHEEAMAKQIEHYEKVTGQEFKYPAGGTDTLP